MKKETIFKLSKDHTYSFTIPDKPLNITISSDGSNAVISTSKKLSLLYFRKLFMREKPKKMLKEEYCDIYKNIGPIEMHPFFDEKENFAAAYENNIFVLKVSKNILDTKASKKFTNQYYDNIKFLAWQNKQNGYLAACSSENVINLYDLRSNKNPAIRIIDDDVCRSIKFSNLNGTYLATGYNNKVKIWDIKRSTVSPILQKKIFSESVDILDWHATQNHLLTGSKRENLLKIFNIKDESINLLFDIKIKEISNVDYKSNKLLKSYFIPGNGIIAVSERTANIYHLDYYSTEVVLDQVIEFEWPITNFKIMTNNLNNHYFVYTDDKNNFTVRMYTFDENLANSTKPYISNAIIFEKKTLYSREIENIRKRYENNISIENKDDKKNVFIFKLFQDLIQIKLKVVFENTYPKSIPQVELIENKYENILIDKLLINNIHKEIIRWYSEEKSSFHNNIGVVEKLIDNLLKIIDQARLKIEENQDDNAKLLFIKQKIGAEQSNFIPYVRTCSFCWSPNGNILTFHYNKIDVKQLKPSEKIINNFNNLEDWIKYCKADKRNKFSRTENKLIEEDTDILITDKLNKLVDWNNVELDDHLIISSINRVESLPNVFMNNFINDLKLEHYPISVLGKEEKNYFLSSLDLNSVNNLSSIFNEQHNKEKSMKKFLIHIYDLAYENHFNRNFIFENLKIKLLSKEHFFGSIDVTHI